MTARSSPIICSPSSLRVDRVRGDIGPQRAHIGRDVGAEGAEVRLRCRVRANLGDIRADIAELRPHLAQKLEDKAGGLFGHRTILTPAPSRVSGQVEIEPQRSGLADVNPSRFMTPPGMLAPKRMPPQIVRPPSRPRGDAPRRFAT
jgi:hypothetical protein